MQSVVDLAQSEEQTASHQLGESLKGLQAQEAKLNELQGYRTSYRQTLRDSNGRETDAIRLGDYRAFLDRLGLAITQQADLVKQAQDDCESKRQAWFAARRRLKALTEVVKRYQSEEKLQTERREQAESDEGHSSRRRRN
jgi:flagellar FliJ protein